MAFVLRPKPLHGTTPADGKNEFCNERLGGYGVMGWGLSFLGAHDSGDNPLSNVSLDLIVAIIPHSTQKSKFGRKYS
eukprot:6467827-Amphidinium_carterae.2